MGSRELGEPWALKASDVAEYLGISREEVYRIEPELLPYLSFGRRRRYRTSDVERFAEQHIEQGEESSYAV